MSIAFASEGVDLPFIQELIVASETRRSWAVKFWLSPCMPSRRRKLSVKRGSSRSSAKFRLLKKVKEQASTHIVRSGAPADDRALTKRSGRSALERGDGATRSDR